MKNDKLEATIRAIVGDAADNNITIKADDPVIQLAVTMNRVVEDQSAAIMAMLDKYREEHAVLAHEWREDAKKSSNIILNAALAASRESMANAMSEGAAKVVSLVTEATGIALEERRAMGLETVREVKRLTVWMLIATGTALVGAVLIAVLV